MNELSEVDQRRLEAAVVDAELAFWVAIAAKYPEVTTGDLGPESVIPFTMACEDVVRDWLT